MPKRAWDQKQEKMMNSQQKRKNHSCCVSKHIGVKKDCKIKYDNLWILLDSSCSDSIAISKYGKKNKQEVKTRKFTTGSGTLKIKYEANIKFTLPEFSNFKIINWEFHVTDYEDLGYDMILGRDIMTQLGINLSFDKSVIHWEGTEVPMRDYRKLKRQSLSKYEIKAIIQSSNE